MQIFTGIAYGHCTGETPVGIILYSCMRSLKYREKCFPPFVSLADNFEMHFISLLGRSQEIQDQRGKKTEMVLTSFGTVSTNLNQN